MDCAAQKLRFCADNSQGNEHAALMQNIASRNTTDTDDNLSTTAGLTLASVPCSVHLGCSLPLSSGCFRLALAILIVKCMQPRSRGACDAADSCHQVSLGNMERSGQPGVATVCGQPSSQRKSQQATVSETGEVPQEAVEK